LQVQGAEFSFDDNLFNAVVHNRDKFVHLFIERVAMDTFLKSNPLSRLDQLYQQVGLFKIAFVHKNIYA